MSGTLLFTIFYIVCAIAAIFVLALANIDEDRFIFILLSGVFAPMGPIGLALCTIIFIASRAYGLGGRFQRAASIKRLERLKNIVNDEDAKAELDKAILKLAREEIRRETY